MAQFHNVQLNFAGCMEQAASRMLKGFNGMEHFTIILGQYERILEVANESISRDWQHGTHNTSVNTAQ